MKRLYLVFFVFSAIFGLVFLYFHHGKTVETSVSLHPSDAFVVVIDAGHGGEDGGAISLTGKKESEINLSISKRLDLVLGLFGVQTLPLREEDISLHDEHAQTLRQKKVSDLHNRVNRINAQENAILISIHQNSYPNGMYSGAQVFFAPTPDSRELAQTVQEQLRLALNPGNTRLEKPIPDTIYLMNHISCPAILVECGFLTNPTEEQLLQSGIYQTKVAMALASGYLNAVAQEE